MNMYDQMDSKYSLANVNQYFTTEKSVANLLFGIKEREEDYKSYYTLYYKKEGKAKEKLAEDVTEAEISSDGKIVHCIAGGALRQVALDDDGKVKSVEKLASEAIGFRCSRDGKTVYFFEPSAQTDDIGLLASFTGNLYAVEKDGNTLIKENANNLYFRLSEDGQKVWFMADIKDWIGDLYYYTPKEGRTLLASDADYYIYVNSRFEYAYALTNKKEIADESGKAQYELWRFTGSGDKEKIADSIKQ